MTWPRNRHRGHQNTSLQSTKHHQPWNGRRLVHSKEMIWASRWSLALRTFYRQILSVLYSSFPFWKLPPPACPGTTGNIDIGCKVFFCCGKQTTFSHICPTKVDQGLLIFWMLLFNLFAWRPGDFPNFIVWVMRSESAMGILHDVWCGVCEAFQGQKNRTLTLADEIHRESLQIIHLCLWFMECYE